MATTLTTDQKKEIRPARKLRATKLSEGGSRSDTGASPNSREEIIAELANLGIDSAFLNPLSTNELIVLLSSIVNLIENNNPHRRRGRPPLDNEHIVLSPLDKKILEYLSSYGNLTSMMLSKKLGMPLSTLQRRRKRLEETLLEPGYTVKLDKLGWRTATLSISVAGANIAELGIDILHMSELVLSATRTIGESKVDLVLEVIFRTNSDLISLIEHIKQKGGVKSVSWNEYVELIGKNKDGYIKAIDSAS